MKEQSTPVEENERLEKEIALLRLKTQTCEIDNEKLRWEIQNSNQEWENFIANLDYQTFMNNTYQLQQESVYPQGEAHFDPCSSSPSQSNFLEPNTTIIISLLRQIDDVIEIDTCSGISTRFGYLTSDSCCRADELILYDLIRSKNIPIDEYTILTDENICFINKTEIKEIRIPVTDNEIFQRCSLSIYDNEQEQFNKHNLELRILGCFDSSCEFKFDSKLYQNQTILNGTLILCEHSSNSAIVTKSKYQLINNLD